VKHVLAIILGGGAGTRLQPLTLTRAKPAVPLGGNYRLIDIPISNCINSGISKIYVLTQFNSQSLNRHISLTYNISSAFNGGEGCQLDRCVVDHCVLGLRLRVEEGVVLKDTLVMGADSFESERERAVVRSHGGVPLGIGKGSMISNAILDKNVRIGCNVQVINKDRVQEADRTALGFTIRSGIVVIEKNTTIDHGTII
jgi:ADP-glucose pyrophosphorylase